jgi:hypothetical protein
MWVTAAPAEEARMYNVVLLLERPLSPADAEQVVALHQAIEDEVRYYVLIPVEEASARIESSLGSIAASEVLATSALSFPDIDLEELQAEVVERSRAALDQSVARLRDLDRPAGGEVTSADPVNALAAAVAERHAEEAIVLTRPHLVAELFHLDWTSKARRRLGVPCLHLLEHDEPDEPPR